MTDKMSYPVLFGRGLSLINAKEPALFARVERCVVAAKMFDSNDLLAKRAHNVVLSVIAYGHFQDTERFNDVDVELNKFNKMLTIAEKINVG